jgi:hypothetical protein
MGNTKAQDVYAACRAEALTLLNQIREALENDTAPSDNTHWGHVGDMGRLVDQLREIVEPDA